MRTGILVLCTLMCTSITITQVGMVASPGGRPMILGRCDRADLGREPFNEWYDNRYNEYHPDAGILNKLRTLNTGEYRFRIFFGTWCGDSRREVPRFMRLLDLLDIADSARELIGVGNRDTLYKRSPGGEETGLGIYRVPTFFITRNGSEVNRITEFPVTSLERDLLSILKGETYTPNYRTYPFLTSWLEEGLLTDSNVSERGLANRIRHLVMNRYELESCGRVLLGRDRITEALTVFRMNRYLFPDEPACYSSLADGLVAAGDTSGALEMLDRALGLTTDPEEQRRIEAEKERIGRQTVR